MLDLKVNTLLNTEKLNNNIFSKGFSAEESEFSKVFESANKSFEATKKAIEEQKPNENKKTEKEETNKNQNKDENEETKEVAQDNTAITLEQILLNYKNNITSQKTENSPQSTQTSQELRETSEKLLHQKEQALEMTTRLMSELKVAQGKLATQNPIQTNEQQLASTGKDVRISPEAALNLQNLANTKVSDNISLADALAEMDAEVTSVKIDTNTQTEAKGFDFNSSTFSNLNSHITKLSLNKTADFSKMMGEKIAQEQQVLNQVKENGINQLGKGSSSVNIVLRPEHLGKVNINIISNNGTVSAQFTAHSQQAADALSKNIETLKQNLLEQGIKVSDVSVKVQETAQSETFADNKNFDGDKLGHSKENNSNRNSYKPENSNNNEEIKQSYFEQEELEEEIGEETSSIHKKNDNLEIYNNMGRTL